MTKKAAESATSNTPPTGGDKASARNRHIYRKTPAGEEAIVQRARVEERQQRMILVLIDGKASLQELSEKVGDFQTTEEAIAALEKNGLIEFDRVKEEAPPPDAPPHEFSPLSHFSTFGEKSENLRAAQNAPARPNVPPARPNEAPARLNEPPIRPQAVSLSSAQTVLSNAPVPPPPARPAPVPPPPPIVIRSTALPTAGKRAAATVKAEALVLPTPIPDPDPDPEPTHGASTPRKPLRETHPRAYVWVRRSLMALGAGVLCVVLVAACVLLYPYNSKRPDLEARLARILGVPVQIGQITPNFSSWRLELRQVRFGENQQSGHLDVIHLPGLFSWLFFEKPGSSGEPVELLSGTLEAAAIVGWLDMAPDGSPDWMRFERLALTLGGNPLAVFEGELRRDANGRLLKATLKSAAPLCQLEFLPPPLSAAQGSAPPLASFTLEVSDWLPSARFPAQLNSAKGKGNLYLDRVALEEVTLFLLGGHYKGRLEAGWRRDGLVENLRGQGTLSRMQVGELMRAWGIANEPGVRGANLSLQGELSGTLRFQTQGDTLALWRRSLNASGDLKADNALLRGIDLTRLVYSGSRGVLTHSRNATTKFQKLSAAFQLNPQGFALENLQTRSSVMHSEEGEIRVTPEGALSGYARLFLGDDKRLENTLVLRGRYPSLRTELTGPRDAEPETGGE
ncbi:MAG: AsmA-like C-terminal region-containing protein [Zoogloeaceae bacterium]|jgi:hypothetical protein|nr:AsmA-like C-terminal region-containing protein [Zoogloeaceae bacterium]